MQEKIDLLKEELLQLQQVKKDNLAAGGVETFSKGDSKTVFTSLSELNIAIKHLQNEISLLEANI